MSLPEGSVILEQAVLWGILALAIQFLLVGLALREERVFLLLGGGLLALCLMVGIDFFILLPAAERMSFGKRAFDAWQDAYNLLACGFVGAMLALLRFLTGRPGPRAARAHAAALAFWALAFLADMAHPADLMVGLRDGQWVTSALYAYGFTPYAVATFGYLTGLAFALRKRGGPQARRALSRLAPGFALLLACGTFDFATLLAGVDFPATAVGGTLLLGVFATFVLADRLVEAWRERRRALLDLARVQGELAAVEPLREIGRSALAVSDAIRSRVAALKEQVDSLERGASPAWRAEAARIEGARRKLERLTQGILDFARSAAPGALAPIDPAALAESSLSRRFADAPLRLRVRRMGAVKPVPADPAGLERALEELVRNAAEAGASQVEVRVRQGAGRTLIAVEDDGVGLADAAGATLEDIPRPFFTLRKAEGGLGLGASIASGIARAHGGSLRWHRRAGGSGLLACLVLPRPEAAREPPRGCTLVSLDPARMQAFLAACDSLGLRPAIVADVAAVSPRGGGEAVLVDGAADAPPALTEEALLERVARAN